MSEIDLLNKDTWTPGDRERFVFGERKVDHRANAIYAAERLVLARRNGGSQTSIDRWKSAIRHHRGLWRAECAAVAPVMKIAAE